MRVTRSPQHRILNGHGKIRIVRLALINKHVAVIYLDAYNFLVRLDIKGHAVKGGCYFYALNVFLGNALHPDGLPDTAHGSVPHAAAIFLLLTVRVKVRKAVADFHRKGLNLVDVDVIGHVDGKRKVPALMMAHQRVVDVDVGNRVNSAEMKQDSVLHKILVYADFSIVGVFARESAFEA